MLRQLLKGKEKDKEKNMEFEVRICGKNFDTPYKMDYYKFENILNNLIFSCDLGGYGFKKYTMGTTLDIKNEKNDIRLTIEGKDDVKMYWLKGEFTESIKYDFMEKKRIKNVDLGEYNTRISLSEENILGKKSKEAKSTIDIIDNNSVMKNYRLKNRYYVESPDGLFRFDLTSIKMSNGTSFKNSSVLKQNPDYEVELEYIGKSKDVDDIFNKLFYNINILLELFQNNFAIIKNSTANLVLDEYNKLINLKNTNLNIEMNEPYSNTVNHRFIVANQVTLHIKNLIKKYQPNILNNYSVTLKADGERHLLFILRSYDRDLNGRMYLIDSNMHVKDMNVMNVNWVGSLIEGEYIKEDNLFLTYDILFERGNDIRHLPLSSLREREKEKTRLGYLELFNKGHENDIFIIQMKNYKFGNIFEKSRELWDNRKNYEFNVDGLIFTPIGERYPVKPGTWDKLFKWKPSEYNSFDFLVKVEKDEKGNPIKAPYVLYDEQGKSTVYQYQTLILFIGKYANILDKTTKKIVKRYVPAEFNPMNLILL